MTLLDERYGRVPAVAAGCLAAGCVRTDIRGYGWCGLHYQRWWKTGCTELGQRPKLECAVEDCTRTDIKGHGWCGLHYKRWWKTGCTELRQRPKLECAVEDCTRTDIEARGWCRKHYDRWRIHGDPDVLGYPSGRAHTQWTESPTYNTAHKRVRGAKGSAKVLPCVDCGAQAAEWSYDHADADELIDDAGFRYSTDTDHYQPRCVACHRTHDARIKMAALATESHADASLGRTLVGHS